MPSCGSTHGGSVFFAPGSLGADSLGADSLATAFLAAAFFAGAFFLAGPAASGGLGGGTPNVVRRASGGVCIGSSPIITRPGSSVRIGSTWGWGICTGLGVGVAASNGGQAPGVG